MKTQLTLPKIETKPKPTKSQIIEALVEREREIWQEKRNAIDAKIKPLRDELHAECFFEMSQRDKSEYRIKENYWNHKNFKVDVEIEITSPKIKKIMEKIRSLDKLMSSCFPEYSVKERIKEAMKSTPKENPLLNNPEVKKALDVMLAQINNAPAAIETQDVEVVTE